MAFRQVLNFNNPINEFPTSQSGLFQIINGRYPSPTDPPAGGAGWGANQVVNQDGTFGWVMKSTVGTRFEGVRLSRVSENATLGLDVGNDQYSKVLVDNPDAGSYYGPVVRCGITPGAANSYALEYFSDTPPAFIKLFAIETVVDTITFHLLGTYPGFSPGNPCTMELRATGVNPVSLVAVLDGQVQATIQDTTYLYQNGQPGFWNFSTGDNIHFRRWEGGDFVVASLSPTYSLPGKSRRRVFAF